MAVLSFLINEQDQEWQQGNISDKEAKTKRPERRGTNWNERWPKPLKFLQNIGTNTSIEVYFLPSHVDKFPDNCGDVSDVLGKRFDQDIKTMEERYLGRWDLRMIDDYSWSIKRDLTVNMTDDQERENFYRTSCVQ